MIVIFDALVDFCGFTFIGLIVCMVLCVVISGIKEITYDAQLNRRQLHGIERRCREQKQDITARKLKIKYTDKEVIAIIDYIVEGKQKEKEESEGVND